MKKDNLIKKWLKDELTVTEQKQFEQFEDFQLNKEIIEGAKHFKASQFSKPYTYEEFKATIETVKKPKKVIRLNTFMRVAAVLVVALGLYFTYFNSSITTVETLASEQNTVVLPDASSVILNAQSTISYDKESWNDNREVKLNGEAFFKVANGSKFNVITDDGIVSVLGTEFTVNQRDNYYEVKCYEGIVQVATKGELHKLTQGKTFRSINNNVSLNEVATRTPSWLNNISNFESVPLKVVLSELERQYGIKVITENVDVERIFTGGFVHNNLEQALIAITTPLEINYRQENENNIILY